MWHRENVAGRAIGTRTYIANEIYCILYIHTYIHRAWDIVAYFFGKLAHTYIEYIYIIHMYIYIFIFI